MQRQVWVGIGIFILMFGILLIISNDSPTTGKVIEDKSQVINGGEPPVVAKELPAEDEPKIEDAIPSTINAKIVSFSYSPNTIEINVGDTVIWENRDSVGHTVTSDDGIELNSRLLSKGQKYSHTFTEIGEYPYYCKPHPYMRGKVIVK